MRGGSSGRRRLLPIATVALLMSATYAAPTARPASAALGTPIPKLVVAAYFPWYGTPTGPTGMWLHWQDSTGTSLIKDHPYALYDSKDPAVMALQLALASYVGIDGFAVSWWGAGSNEDQNFGILLNTAASLGVPIKLAAQFETTGLASGGVTGITNQLAYLLQTYTTRPSYLQVGGRPVVFVYNPAAFSTDYTLWASILRTPAIAQFNAMFIVDSFTDGAARVFDGLYTFAPFGPNLPYDPAALFSKYQAAAALARSYGKVYVPAVAPGFDDSAVRTPSMIIPRSNYTTYVSTWQIALATQPDWVFIDSWNEWHEATELEPSLEYGTTYDYVTAVMASYLKPTSAPGLAGVPAALRSLIGTHLKNGIPASAVVAPTGARPSPKGQFVLPVY